MAPPMAVKHNESQGLNSPHLIDSRNSPNKIASGHSCNDCANIVEIPKVIRVTYVFILSPFVDHGL